MQKKKQIAVLGYGVVGSGVVELFYQNQEKIEKNTEFSSKLGVKNTSDFMSDKQQKMNHSQLDEC